MTTEPFHNFETPPPAFADQTAIRFGVIGSGMVIAVIGFWYMLMTANAAASGSPTFGVDFIVFWSAAQLALGGNALAAFDIDSLQAIHQVEDAGWLPWVYPPGYLLLLMPLGLLPFFPAWIVFNSVSALAFLAALRPFTAGATGLWLAIGFAPTTLAAFMLGQTPILWIAGLLAALACLRSGRLIMAGVFFGILTLKPQLGLLIPVALLAGGYWRTVLSAAVTAIAIALAGTLAFGFEYWAEFSSMAEQHYLQMRSSIGEDTQMISAYSMLIMLGFGDAIAFAAQIALTAIAAIAIFITWRRADISADLKCAMLLAGILVTSPYMWHYEAAFLAPLLLFLIRAGVVTPSLPGLILPALLWLGVGPLMIARIFIGNDLVPIRPYATPILALGFAVTLIAVLTALRHITAQKGP